MTAISVETYRQLARYVDLTCSQYALDLEEAIVNFAPVYARVLHELLTDMMSQQEWFTQLPSFQQDYCITYAHFRYSAWVLQHILGGNVELFYRGEAYGDQEGGPEEDEAAYRQEDGGPQGEGEGA